MNFDWKMFNVTNLKHFFPSISKIWSGNTIMGHTNMTDCHVWIRRCPEAPAQGWQFSSQSTISPHLICLCQDRPASKGISELTIVPVSSLSISCHRIEIICRSPEKSTPTAATAGKINLIYGLHLSQTQISVTVLIL